MLTYVAPRPPQGSPPLGHMNTRLIIPLLVAGALAFACGPRSRSEAPTALASAVPLSANTIVSHPSKRHDGGSARSKASVEKLDSRFHVAVDKRQVHFALNVQNVGTKHVELDFPSGKSYDFVVVDSVGREVWRWSNGRMFTQGLQNKQLGTGDNMQVSETWTKPAPGRYTAIATLNSTNYPVEQRVDFTMQ